jgi:hypothetical protein
MLMAAVLVQVRVDDRNSVAVPVPLAQAALTIVDVGGRAVYRSPPEFKEETMTTLLGWREWVALPALGVSSIKAKVDTGARSSALHVLTAERLQRDGRSQVRFQVESAGPDSPIVECVLAVADERPVTDSGGHTTLRPFVLTTLQVGAEVYQIELNLMPRHGMRFPLLLGRTALAGRFLVDSSKEYLSGRRLAPG